MPQHWQGRAQFVMFDSDYGDGARFQATLAAWRADSRRPERLHVIALVAPGVLLPGVHRMLQSDEAVVLDLFCGQPAECVAQIGARIDALYLHAQAEPAMIGALGRKIAAGATLYVQAPDPSQRQALTRLGFVWNNGTDGLSAVFKPRQPQAAAPVAPQRRAIVIGAGVAGSAACERLCARGWQVTLIERHRQPAQEASGNHAGIFMPVLSRDDNLNTRLVRAAYLFALRYWERLGGVGRAFAGASCGVLQLARDGAHAQIQRQIAAAAHYPREFAEWYESDAAAARFGVPAPDGAWLFRQGGWARPASVCAAMLAACGARLQTHFGVGALALTRANGQWQVMDGGGAIVASAPTLILANGAGAGALAQAAQLPIAMLRGQVTHLAADSVTALPFVLCREAYMTPAVDGIVSVGATYDSAPDARLCAASQQQNLNNLRAILHDPDFGRDAPLAGRVGYRCVAPDRLPLVGALPDLACGGRAERLRDVARHAGLHALLGYASRGLIWAPLCAELLAAQLNGEPVPLEAKLAEALDPARFYLRELRRNNSIENQG